VKRILLLFTCWTTILVFIGISSATEKVFFYTTDPAGSPVAITDSTGNVVWRADYKPFGQEQSITGSLENNERFVGKEKDKETGLDYFGARYMYDKAGRFISPDPVGPVDPWNGKVNYKMLTNPQRLNAYADSVNNPYRYVDTDGKWPEEIHNTIISRAFGKGPATSAMQRGSIEADTSKYQDNAHSYMHAMRAPGQSAEEAAGRTATFIMEKVGEYKTLMAAGQTDKAYEALGMGMHPLMDNTSPSHVGFQEWHLIPLIDAGIHKRRETEGVFNSNADYSKRSVDAIRNLYNEATK